MGNLLRFFIKFHHIFLFLLLEVIGITLLVNFNSYHGARFSALRHSVLGSISRRVTNLTDYFSLREENRALIDENNKLYNLLRNAYRVNSIESIILDDSSYLKQFDFISARVINNSSNKKYNYITIDRGSNDSIEVDDGVFSVDGLVGKIYAVSPHFSTILPIINTKFRVPALINNTSFYGPLRWSGKGNKAFLADIPHHARIKKGDSIVTSQHSSFFPEGIPIGKITDFKKRGGNFYEIDVELFTDFYNISTVQVVKNRLKEERLLLESMNEDD